MSIKLFGRLTEPIGVENFMVEVIVVVQLTVFKFKPPWLPACSPFDTAAQGIGPLDKTPAPYMVTLPHLIVKCLSLGLLVHPTINLNQPNLRHATEMAVWIVLQVTVRRLP